MQGRRLTLLVVVALAGMALLAGCARRPAPSAPVASEAPTSAVAMLGKSVAVAPFTNPQVDYDLLSGFMPMGAKAVPETVPARLDIALGQALAGQAAKVTLVPGGQTAQCAKSVHRADQSGRLATIKYWQSVGACAGADFLVVPMVLAWQERQGSAIGSTAPAGVNLSIYLLDVRTGGVLKNIHFEEVQRTLSENILDAKKFMERKGQWLTATELATEGINQAVKELGL